MNEKNEKKISEISKEQTRNKQEKNEISFPLDAYIE